MESFVNNVFGIMIILLFLLALCGFCWCVGALIVRVTASIRGTRQARRYREQGLVRQAEQHRREREALMPRIVGLAGLDRQTAEQLKRAITLRIPFTYNTLEGRRVAGACAGCKGATYVVTVNDKEVVSTCNTCLVVHCTIQKKVPLYIMELITLQFPDYAEALTTWENRERKVLPVPEVPQEPLSLAELSRYLKTTKGYGHNHAYTSVTNAVNMARKRLMEEIGQQEIYAERVESKRGRSNQQAKVHRQLADLLRKTVATLPE